jgi:hypothetical protein
MFHGTLGRQKKIKQIRMKVRYHTKMASLEAIHSRKFFIKTVGLLKPVSEFNAHHTIKAELSLAVQIYILKKLGVKTSKGRPMA